MPDKSSFGQKYRIDMPTLSDMQLIYAAPPAPSPLLPDPSHEVIALACMTYAGVDASVFDAHRMLAGQVALDYPPGNWWMLQTHPRLPYPYGLMMAIRGMICTEEERGREADWFFYLDDDVEFSCDIIRKLRAAADPKERPFVAAAAYDRNPPFRPAVWETHWRGELETRTQWEDVPESGTYQVSTTGLCAALFHRSLFKRVPEPWFACLPPSATGGGINPDAWWCQKLGAEGIPVYVSCDTVATHWGFKMPVNRQTAPLLRKIFNRRGTGIDPEPRQEECAKTKPNTTP